MIFDHKSLDMKTTLLSLLLTLASLALIAQEETLFNNLDVTGAFGGPIIEIGSINGEIGADVGGGGALVMSATPLTPTN